MTAYSTHAVLPLALVAGAMVLTVAACGGGATGPTPSSAGRPTVTVAAPTVTVTAPSTPSASPTTSATGTGTGGPVRCDPMNMLVSYADDKGGAGAGSVMGTFTILNRGTAGCTLRGFPGVAYVGGENGVQVGVPATRTDDKVTTKTLAVGKTAEVAVRRTQPRNYGEQCQEAKVTGFQVYLPESTRRGFVAFKTTGCRSADAPLLQVGPVR